MDKKGTHRAEKKKSCIDFFSRSNSPHCIYCTDILQQRCLISRSWDFGPSSPRQSQMGDSICDCERSRFRLPTNNLHFRLFLLHPNRRRSPDENGTCPSFPKDLQTSKRKKTLWKQKKSYLKRDAVAREEYVSHHFSFLPSSSPLRFFLPTQTSFMYATHPYMHAGDADADADATERGGTVSRRQRRRCVRCCAARLCIRKFLRTAPL